MTAPGLSKCSCVLRALDVGGFILGSFYATSGSLAALGWGWLEGSLTGVNMKKSVLTLTPLNFHLWCALSSFYSWWLFSYGAQTWTSLDTEQLLALLFFFNVHWYQHDVVSWQDSKSCDKGKCLGSRHPSVPHLETWISPALNVMH